MPPAGVRLLVVMALLAVTAPASGAPALVQTVDVSTDGEVAVRIHLSRPVAPHAGAVGRMGGNPDRLFVDLPDTVLGPGARAAIPGRPPVVRVRTGQHEASARVVIDLEHATPFTMKTEGALVSVTVVSATQAPAVAAPPPPANPPPVEAPPAASSPPPKAEEPPPPTAAPAAAPAENHETATDAHPTLLAKAVRLARVGSGRRMTIDLNRPPQTLRRFMIMDPPRLVIEVDGVLEGNATASEFVVSDELVKGVTADSDGTHLRLVVQLQGLLTVHDVRPDGSAVVADLGDTD